MEKNESEILRIIKEHNGEIFLKDIIEKAKQEYSLSKSNVTEILDQLQVDGRIESKKIGNDIVCYDRSVKREILEIIWSNPGINQSKLIKEINERGIKSAKESAIRIIKELEEDEEIVCSIVGKNFAYYWPIKGRNPRELKKDILSNIKKIRDNFKFNRI